ncbi:hypothetical protein [Streptomyces sp. NPDC001893]|uniref:HNH endonuclease n=1 Tax=Streptomyces sp. NPDC001893 TaxID=3154530 RepID=UPI00331C4017
MRRLPPPAHTAADSFCACISRVRDAGLKKRLEDSQTEVVAAATRFAEAVPAVALHSLEQGDFKLDTVTDREMADVYTLRMAAKKGAGRKIYDDLILGAEGGHCPLCGQRDVSTLDHHLPKKRFPTLAVAPLNLIPACADCNKVKGEKAPKHSEEETLHPYFDDIESDLWLRAAVVETTPAALRFFVSPPDNWDSVLTGRVRHHFKAFGIAKLYASQAAVELCNITHQLTEAYTANPTDGVRRVKSILEEAAESRCRARLNSWQSATYRALADSSWYCQGGFLTDEPA